MLETALRMLSGAALAGALAAIASGQAARKPTFVRCVGPDGEAVAGAEVTFAGGSPSLGVEAQRTDVQVVQTDARGRARARLLADLCYVAWAVGPASEDGAVLISPVAGFFGAGALRELQCRPGALARVELVGAEAWADHGPLRCVLVTPHPGVELEIERTADGSLSWPAVESANVEVQTAAGEPLWQVSVTGEADIPPPARVAVRVVDETGAPVAGARIRHRVGVRHAWRHDGIAGVAQPRMRVVGTTDGAGEATVVVPYPTDPLREARSGWMMLFADAPGRAVVAGGTNGRHVYVDDRRVEGFDGEVLTFTLPAVTPVRTAPGVLPPGTVGQLTAVCKMRSRGNSYMHDPRSFFSTVGADGRLAFDNVPADVHSLRLCLRLPDGAGHCAFEGLSGRTLPPELTAEGDEKIGGRLGAVELRVLDVTGGPARGAVVCLVPARSRGVLQRDSMFRLPLDSAGRGEVRLSLGGWVAVVVTDDGFAVAGFELEAGRREVELRLEPMATMKLVLRDREGEPIAGARVRITGSRTASTADARQNALRHFARSMRDRWSALQTDGDGALTLPFLPVETMTWTVSLHWSGGSTDKFAVEAAETPVELFAK